MCKLHRDDNVSAEAKSQVCLADKEIDTTRPRCDRRLGSIRGGQGSTVLLVWQAVDVLNRCCHQSRLGVLYVWVVPEGGQWASVGDTIWLWADGVPRLGAIAFCFIGVRWRGCANERWLDNC